MRKSLSLSIFSFSLHFLYIFSFALNFLFIFSFSCHFLGSGFPASLNLCRPGRHHHHQCHHWHGDQINIYDDQMRMIANDDQWDLLHGHQISIYDDQINVMIMMVNNDECYLLHRGEPSPQPSAHSFDAEHVGKHAVPDHQDCHNHFHDCDYHICHNPDDQMTAD